MADATDPIQPDDLDPVDGSGPSYETEPPEIEDDAPRRAASARFIVDSEVGSEAAMRDAMDPANQSLADALRLSYRVLQAVILVLLVLFLASGYKTVEDGQSGVRTVWGKIKSVDGEMALKSGPQFSLYPYPIGEFVLFEVENRSVDLGDVFQPPTAGLDRKAMLERAEMTAAMMPGRFGSVITRDGDLAHLDIKAKYDIDDPEAFAKRVSDADETRDSDKIVKLALQRAAIHVTAGLGLQDVIDMSDDTKGRIRSSAQQVLDELHCGIRMQETPPQIDGYGPLAIEKSRGDLQASRVFAAEQVEKARQKESETHNAIAGADYGELVALIEQYEAALERTDDAESNRLQEAINAKLDTASGQVSTIIGFARTYQSQVESTLGNEQRRFDSLFPAYRANPELLVKQQWLDMLAAVTNHPDTEIMYVSEGSAVTIDISGSSIIAERRRKGEMKRRENEALMKSINPLGAYILRATDTTDRQLDLKDDGKSLGPTGQQK